MPEGIRTATDADGDGIAALIAEVFSEHDGCIFDREREFPELARIASHFAERDGAFWVHQHEGAVAGSLGIMPAADGMELHKVYLRRAMRGRDIARALLDRGVAFARRKGARRIVLWTDSRFVAGHRFYEKHGFLRTCRTRQLNDISRSFEFEFVLPLKEAPQA